MGWFRSDEEFWKAFERLQALTGRGYEWTSPEARKDYTDQLGSPIKRGETYFKKEYGIAWGTDVKFSRTSMEELLFAVVASSPLVEKIADRLIEAERTALIEAVKSVEPMARVKTDDEPL